MMFEQRIGTLSNGRGDDGRALMDATRAGGTIAIGIRG